MSCKELVKAIAYFRTSSDTNVGADKDSTERQRQAVAKYAEAAGYEVIAEYSDDGIKGADPVDQRPGFSAMMAHIAGNGVRTILVETASRFARDILVQETGHRFLKERGIDLIAVDSPDAFLDDTPTSKMVRQLLGVISEFEKASTVARLAAARHRKRKATGQKVEGRKTHLELRPDMVALAKTLARKKPKGGKLSLRAVSAAMAAQGFVNERGKPFHPQSIAEMLR
jgi:DNA invertase Pin-like site-specific DNA recombinase